VPLSRAHAVNIHKYLFLNIIFINLIMRPILLARMASAATLRLHHFGVSVNDTPESGARPYIQTGADLQRRRTTTPDANVRCGKMRFFRSGIS
jgi:hypothetical protein